MSMSLVSHAGILIEPLVGYSSGKFTTESSNNSSGELSVKGMSYGGRLGYQNVGFQVGLDYLKSNMSADEGDLKTSELGLFVGFEFPVLFRVYAGYIVSGKGTLSGDDPTEEDVDLKGGTGPKLGVGLTLLPFLDFNVEYRNIKYDSQEASGINQDHDYNAIMVGFSLPFVL